MNNDLLDTAILEDYLDGKLDAKAMHYVERLSLEDPFVAEALDGLKQAPKRRYNLSLLQKQLQERINQQPLKRKRWGIVTHRLSIAATAAVLFVTASLVFWMQESNRRKQQQYAGKKVEVNLAPISGSSTKLKEQPNVQASLKKTVPAVKASVKRKGSLLAGSIRSGEVLAQARVKPDASKAIAGRIAAVKMASAIPAGQSAFSGRVVSQRDGHPIPGAAIKDRSDQVIATTDKDGAFKIKSDSLAAIADLKIDYRGYKSKAVTARLNEPVNVILHPESLKNPVFAGESDRIPEVNINAGQIVMPLGGWNAFGKYLSKENRLLGRKTNDSVELQFTILKDGTPANFKIIKGINNEFNAEAIRLLKDGPKWNTNGREGALRYVVRF